MEQIAEILSPEKQVQRQGDTVCRPRRPWSPSVRLFLQFLEQEGLPVEHMRALTPEQEVYDFIPGEMVHPYRWKDEALFAVGGLVAALHRAGARFYAEHPRFDVCQPWCLREIGCERRIWCHGDVAPWNLLTKGGMPLRLVDWEFAGPLDPLVELARVCWLFPQLVDDDLQQKYDLPSPEGRAAQVRLVCDGYGLARCERARLVEQMIEVVICETAHEAIDPHLQPEDEGCLWGFAWRIRSLYWIWRHRQTLEQALA